MSSEKSAISSFIENTLVTPSTQITNDVINRITNILKVMTIIYPSYVSEDYTDIEYLKDLLTYLKYTVYLYSMNDIYKKNKPSGQPMAIRNLGVVQIESSLHFMWVDRLITSMYIVLSASLITISLALMFGLSI